MDESALRSVGFAWPSPAYLFGVLVFSIVGFAAFRHGKKTARYPTMAIGLVLMLYPYAVSRTGWLYAVGCALCVGLWWDHR